MCPKLLPHATKTATAAHSVSTISLQVHRTSLLTAEKLGERNLYFSLEGNVLCTITRIKLTVFNTLGADLTCI